MDTGRTTLIMFAAAAAITVAHRIGQQRAARLVAEADRIAASVSRLTSGQKELRRGQEQMTAAMRRLEVVTAELRQMGDEVVSTQSHQMRAVVGAYEAMSGRHAQACQARHHLREVSAPEG